MKTLKKLFSVSAIVALLGTLAPMYAFGATYTDELEDAYAYARANGVTTKNTIDQADMYGSLTRIAMAKMIANYATSVLGLEADTSRNCTFSDVPAALDAEYGKGVTNACQLGLMGIDDNGNVKATFDPKGIVTRAQFATALSRAISQAEDGEAIANGNPYYRTHIAYLNGKGIVKSEAEYDVNSVEKRGYVMLMMMRADNNYTPSEGCTTEEIVACALEDDTAACLAACTQEEEEEQGNGLVTISKVSAAATQEVAYNAVKKNVGTIKLKAGPDGAVISSVVVKRSGLGSNIASIQLASNDGNYTTAARKVGTDGEATVRFSPALELKANQSMNFDVLVSLNGSSADNANETHTFTVTSANLANGKSEGSATLGTLRTTSYGVSEVTVSFAQATYNIKAGETKTIAKVNMNTDKDMEVNGFTLSKKSGIDFDKAFANVKAYYNNKEVGKVTVSSDRIIVSNLHIEKAEGANVAVELKADGIYIGGGNSSVIYFDALSDIDVIETSTQEAMQIKSPLLTSTVTVNLAQVNLEMTKVTTGAITVAPGVTDVVLYDAKIESSTDFDAIEYIVTQEKGTNLNNFTQNRVKLVVDGTPIYLTISDSNYDAGTKTWTFTNKDLFTVTAGTPARVKIMGNLKDTIIGTPEYQFSFNLKTLRDVENTSNTMSAGTTKLDGDVVSVANGKLDVKSATVAAPASRNVRANGTDIEIARFALKATAENVTVNKVVFTNAGDAVLVNTINSAKLINVKTNEVIASNGKVSSTAVAASEANCTFAELQKTDEEDDCYIATLPADEATYLAGDPVVKTIPAQAGILFDSLTLEVEKDVDVNVKLVVTTKSFTTLGNTLVMSPVINSEDTNKTSGGEATVNDTFTAVTDPYKTSVQSPVITLEKVRAGVFEVTVKNNDTANDITLTKIKAQVKANNSDFEGYFGSRELGATTEFDTNLVSDGAVDLTVGVADKVVSKNGGEYKFEIAVSSNYNMATGLSLHVTRLDWTSGSPAVAGYENYDLTTQEE